MTALVFLVLVLIAATIIYVVIRHWVRKHGAGTLIWRFVSGQHLDGRLRTDAGWLRPGARVMHPTGHATRWAHLPHLHRAGIRWGTVAIVATICAGLAIDRPATVIALASTAAVGLVLAGWLTARRAHHWAHVRRYVRPLHRALAPALGIPLTARPQSWLTIPRDFTQVEGSKIRLALPEGFLTTADAKRVIMTAITDKLAIENSSVEWQTVGKVPAAIVTMSAPPPSRLNFDQVQARISEASESAPVIGLGRSGAVVGADYEADSPHVLVSAGSGGGKSTIVRGLLSQGLHNGAVGIVCDIKRISHSWTRGMPNVIYSRSIPEIHNILIAVKTEVDRRNELVDDLADENGDIPADMLENIGPRIILTMEEMNATASRLAAYWRKIKAKEDPAVSPAVEALADILFMGRAVRVNVIAVAQMMTARTLGGPEARENFATRILARYTVNAWKMLVPEVWPMPRASRHPGRVQVVIAGVARETQVVFFTPAEARSWGLAGTVVRFRLPEPGGMLTAQKTAHTLGSEPVSCTGALEPVGLREAIGAGILGRTSLDSARWARANDPDFPEPAAKRGQEYLYWPNDLSRWEDNRPRALRVVGE